MVYIGGMRTTLTLDEDVAARLQDLQRKNNLTFKDAVNLALRLGLEQRAERVQKRKPFKVTPKNMGLLPGLRYDNIGELLEQIEGALHK
jgi:hypothetical protein